MMAAAEPALPVRRWWPWRDTATTIGGPATRCGLLVDRLGDRLEVGLGLLGRGGRRQGAVEDGGQGLGDGQLSQLGADQLALAWPKPQRFIVSVLVASTSSTPGGHSSDSGLLCSTPVWRWVQASVNLVGWSVVPVRTGTLPSGARASQSR
jgi:hypothetical protein